ncbi:protein kinase 2B, chloroplastic-like [Gossypium australe]|uniref:Protein kinase 2B, chloroplastic-like n=1 Tax=Gossypium australe TaxID=47621 RepID=A0A5B6WTP0_9ROSI|nr:protein kinase 2B, chloroplastic-like [Gossypium australe]
MLKKLWLIWGLGIIEDELVKADKFIFPIDFGILDMDEDIEVLMILATARTVIDVGNGELVLSVGDEKVTLQARDFVRVPNKRGYTRYFINVGNHVARHSL